MATRSRTKLFRWGRRQAVLIPRAFELPADEAILRKEGDRLVIEPVPQRSSLMEYLTTLEPIDFPDIRDQPPEPTKL